MIATTNRRELVTLALIASTALLVALIYSGSFVTMAGVWSDGAYRHGIAVFPISAYLLWRLRGPLAAVELKPWPPGLVALAALVALWLVGRAVGIQVAEHLAIVLLIPAAIATCLGLGVARRAAFPLFFLIAAVPVGDALIPYLMRVTADVAAALLRTVGVPVYREGQFITLPGGEFEVASVCSGLRYLVAGVMISLLFAYLAYRSTWRRVALAAAAAVSLVVVNGVRAFIVMWVASATEMRVLGGDDHIYFGWLLFAVVIGVLLWFAARYSDDVPIESPHATQQAAGGIRNLPTVLVFGLLMLAVTAKPLQQGSNSIVLAMLPAGVLLIWGISRLVASGARSSDRGRLALTGRYAQGGSAVILGLGVAVLVAGPVLFDRFMAASSSVSRITELPVLAGCAVAPRWQGDWEPEFRSPDFSVAASYECQGQPVNVFVAGYLRNVQGKELVSEDNLTVPGAWRRFAITGASRFSSARGYPVDVNEVRADGGGVNVLIWYWYMVGDRPITKPVSVKAIQVWEFLRSGRSDGAVFWLETPLAAGLATARERLAAVARAIDAARSHSPSGDGGA